MWFSWQTEKTVTKRGFPHARNRKFVCQAWRFSHGLYEASTIVYMAVLWYGTSQRYKYMYKYSTSTVQTVRASHILSNPHPYLVTKRRTAYVRKIDTIQYWGHIVSILSYRTQPTASYWICKRQKSISSSLFSSLHFFPQSLHLHIFLAHKPMLVLVENYRQSKPNVRIMWTPRVQLLRLCFVVIMS